MKHFVVIEKKICPKPLLQHEKPPENLSVSLKKVSKHE